ncbi:DUF305 domain-containing protein [Nocardioides mangrovi]|uniref:DUF305 domain-containing protein n=1 Tax=Nocardioides mangrovi TaxID=2874580 RepID=A0ABS7UH05_9ACTN|nr:DUF305 domain-containing protein [Nocardioides mangrovi]MBZ5740318.1 DUF305 domain-containing protein [Nocardioides mangrovi]
MHTHTHRTTRRAAALVLALTTGLTLAACGSDDSDADASPSATHTDADGQVHNDADVAFATEMIPHHAQAVQMVAMTRGRPLDPAVRRLAEDIRAAQTPEIETMVDWLTAWGEDVPATSMDHAHAGHGSDGMDGMDMSGTDGMDDMPGMMSTEEMQDLSDASDDAFQDMWLRMMIEHHEGAIEMAGTESEDGVYDDALALADSIATSQQREIDTMQGLLD